MHIWQECDYEEVIKREYVDSCHVQYKGYPHYDFFSAIICLWDTEHTRLTRMEESPYIPHLVAPQERTLAFSKQ